MRALLAFALALAAGSAASAQDRVAQEREALARHAREPGVTTLPGLQYQVLVSGPAAGPRPSRSDTVTVRYVGRYLDGRSFGASPDEGRGTTSFPLQRLIPGWLSALQLMRPGDRWRLWLPPHLGYGWKGKDPIPPDATLVFDVELVSFAPAPPPSADGR